MISALRIFLVSTFFVLSAISANCDVLYTFDYDQYEFIVGEKKERLLVGYTANRKYSDKRSRLTSSFMKKWFGKEQELRYTTVFLMDKDILRQIDYGKEKILETSFSKLLDPKLHKRIKNRNIPQVKRVVDARYVVKKPLLTVKKLLGSKKIGDYSVRHVQATLTLETYDKKKNTISRTEILLDLFLTEDIQGYQDYKNFYSLLGKRFGIDSIKFGNLERLTKYMQDSLKLNEAMRKATGFPVKTVFQVKAIYITKPNTSSEKRVEKVLKKETVHLKKVTTGPFDQTLFNPPGKWRVKRD
jgi:hypothetical protein